ncbi:cation-transporting P-type ATPase [Halorhodospira halophila]|uniref:ATPase, P-type (Transporting), HAD superfamily, subfamily IC n=1 Tax=Halorhodospira halophila (strain DSM 244 / SL1) TaxID=349124 RepID=A1WU86_HALHL|nr:cation-transporting P-type ATPase [Halorhodospira halophila]ABM61248.1 ATPase, P-type (transporting), HAD superfamily, subfamily IC [Halorhodospira halophila SL1]MBK1730020.1 carbonate dehydratase [Halorhodospira halophila]
MREGAGQAEQRQADWHAIHSEEVVSRLEAQPGSGLSSEQAEQRLEHYGPNRLRPPEREGPIKRFLKQFHNVLIYILIVAGVVTALLGHTLDSAVIFGVVLINAIIGHVQEGKAEKALDAIRGMLSPRAVVLRDGERMTVNAEHLVPGDIVLLEAGDRVPADVRILEARNLRLDEAALTGESVPVEKADEPVAVDAELGDRKSLAFSGTLVAYGRGQGVVVGTGEATEIGKVSSLIAGVESITTPLLRQVAEFGRWLSVAIVLLAAATFLIGYYLQAYTAIETFLAAVALAVAAIPEGLPAIMTITLAIGVQRMAGRNAIIRRLPAVETLGSVTTICSDKTGTLTRNEMTVRSVVTAEQAYEVSGVGYVPDGAFHRNGGETVSAGEEPVLAQMLRGVALCNEAALYHRDGNWRLEGDPTEGALMVAAVKGGFERRELDRSFPRVDVIPFESSYKFMVTLHREREDGGLLIMKGAPERVLAACTRERTADGDRPLDRDHWQEVLDGIASRGQRLLAVAVKETDPDHRELLFSDVEEGMVFLGVMGIIDPPREEAIEAVAECHRAGIGVKMITGDHALTAGAIGEQLGIRGKPLVGHEIEAMDDEELGRRCLETDVFARTTPIHKLRLVQALQGHGQVVAMTGDGVNDAPALKRADVGIAMGNKGTEAAKEASEMVLADDNFASIAYAVEEGRTVYDNLKKAILYLLPTNGGQAFTIVIAIMFGLTLPVTPVQALWINMVTAVTLALALAFEPPEPGLMERRPRDPAKPILSGFLIWRVLFVSVLLVMGTFGHYVYMEAQGVSDELARSVAINTLVMGQVFYLFNARYILEPVTSVAGLLGSRAVLIAIGVLIVLQGLFTYAPPVQALFGTAGLGPEEWLRVLVFGVLLFGVVELEKAVLRRRISPED